MKYKIYTIILMLTFVVSTNSYGDEKYVNAKIERIETCININGHNLLIFLKDTSGTSPSVSNGCSNDAVLPFIRLAANDNPEGSNEAFLSVALVAYATDKALRIRYDDTDNQAVSIALIN